MTDRASDAGYTLVELLITILIISVGLVAVLGALQVGVSSGHAQRGLSNGELSLLGLAEHVRSQPYLECAGPGDYEVGFAPATGITAEVVAIAYWDGEISGGAPLSFQEDCPSDGDLGLQRIEIQAAEPSLLGASSQTLAAMQETLIVKRAG